jgi:hypothetical protein
VRVGDRGRATGEQGQAPLARATFRESGQVALRLESNGMERGRDSPSM